MKKGVFFDLDGTLWDALFEITESWNKAMKDNALSYSFLLEKIKTFMGLTPEETAPLAFPDVDLETGLKYFSLALNEEIKYMKNNPGKLYEDEIEVLKELSNKYPLFIVSNSDKGYIENYLNYYSLNNLFKDHVCAGDTSLPKYKNIILLKEKYELDEVIYVGDTKKDMDESLKAGVKFIHALYGFGEIKEKVLSIKNLKELPQIIEKAFKS